MTVRQCTLEDVNWLMEAAELFFGDKVKDYGVARAWVEKALQSSQVLFVRTDDSALVAAISSVFFDPQSPKAIVQFFGGRFSEVEMLFRAAKNWAEMRGVRELYFQPKTGYDAAPLASTLGAEKDFPSYVWRF